MERVQRSCSPSTFPFQMSVTITVKQPPQTNPDALLHRHGGEGRHGATKGRRLMQSFYPPKTPTASVAWRHSQTFQIFASFDPLSPPISGAEMETILHIASGPSNVSLFPLVAAFEAALGGGALPLKGSDSRSGRGLRRTASRILAQMIELVPRIKAANEAALAAHSKNEQRFAQGIDNDSKWTKSQWRQQLSQSLFANYRCYSSGEG